MTLSREPTKSMMRHGAWIAAAVLVALGSAGCAPDNEGPSRIGERTREILQMQNEAKPDRRPAMKGPEAQRILENYSKSIGQGGAGATLPPKASTN